jgi:hypothetical protein
LISITTVEFLIKKSTDGQKGEDMKPLLISMVIGVAAGLLDILPMIAQRLEKRAIISAFLQYFFVSIVIVNINLPGIAWWVQGSLISLALALPVIIIVSEKDTKSVPIIACMAIILGGLIGIAGHYIK